MNRVLFVDDEPNVLDGLRRMLRGLRHDWEMAFVPSGAAALEAMEQQPFHVVVADMKMPGMDGAQLLETVKVRHPDSVRIILSGHSELSSVLKSVGCTHQYLAKPCDPDTLKRTIVRAQALRTHLEDDRLQSLVSKMDALPSLPSLFQEVVAELQKSHSSLTDVGKIIAKDIGMTAKILQLVNSAYFGLLRPITSVERAVAFLGLETINSLVLSVSVFSEYEGATVSGFSIETLWQHSLATASFAKAIAAAEVGETDKQLVNDAFMAGMVHDVGKLVLIANEPEHYGQILERASGEETASDAESDLLGASHAAVGAYLVGLWGLPDSIVEAIAYHANPADSHGEAFSPLTAVHVANGLSIAGPGAAESDLATAIDLEYLQGLGLSERLPAWQDACRGLLEAGAANG